ncbi:putative GPI-anchored protein [Vitis vinifera]|uniref:Putative GPI-anchored protein n=1 Tax=Vitis vinifera TaxID=29760 RepID=A0A438JG59_VITVI|nr:putative GPI-anchored protein [Vitis vinifera]
MPLLRCFLPEISPSGAPQPFLPLLAPSPLTPFTTNSTIPKLSGLCSLNFSAGESMISMTSIDCWAVFASVLAIKDTNLLALNGTLAKHCLSDVEQILVSQGASDKLHQICSIHPSSLTEGSCPVKDVNEFESIVDSTKLLSACEQIDLVKECCNQICQNAILEAARKIALKLMSF